MSRTTPTTDVRALTFKQPWAWCVTNETKRVENRTWEPKGDWRGPLALHAGKTLAPADLARLQEALAAQGQRAPRRQDLTLGAVVALTRLVDIHPADRRKCDEACRGWGEFPTRRELRGKTLYHWCLGEVTVLKKPVACTGALQLWKLPDDVAAAVAAQTRRSHAWKP